MKMSSIFYGCMGARICLRLRARSGAFTNPDGAYWGPIDKYLLHCIRTFRAGFEPFRPVSNTVSKKNFFESGLSRSKLVEYASNPVRNTNESRRGHSGNHQLCFCLNSKGFCTYIFCNKTKIYVQCKNKIPPPIALE